MILILTVIFVVGLSVLGTYGFVTILRHRLQNGILREGTRDIEGFYITVLGTLYAILIAFMIFAVWGRFYEATVGTSQEADNLADVYRFSRTLPEPYKRQARQLCLEYGRTMIKNEWTEMARNEYPKQGWVVVDKMWKLFGSISQSEVADPVIRDHLFTNFTELTDLRHYRLLASQSSLPGILYGVLLFGAILTVGFASIFAADDFGTHALKACVLAALISFMLFTVWSLDRPFSGKVHVPSTPFARVIELIEKTN